MFRTLCSERAVWNKNYYLFQTCCSEQKRLNIPNRTNIFNQFFRKNLLLFLNHLNSCLLFQNCVLRQLTFVLKYLFFCEFYKRQQFKYKVTFLLLRRTIINFSACWLLILLPHPSWISNPQFKIKFKYRCFHAKYVPPLFLAELGCWFVRKILYKPDNTLSPPSFIVRKKTRREGDLA